MRYLTAGESHGEELLGIIEGLPSGLEINLSKINSMLATRQQVYGRGSRSSRCPDTAEIRSGVYGGKTTGAPIAVAIKNGSCGTGEFDFFRPGHVDYAAAVKYGYDSPWLGAERASARETSIRTALGSIALMLLSQLGITVKATVAQIGNAVGKCNPLELSEDMKREIDGAGRSGDTLGGKIKVSISGLKAGFGSHVHFDRRLDGILAGALMSIPSVKAVEVGFGTDFACVKGSEVADILIGQNGNIARKSNFGGGIEGGISNGEDITLTLTLKPIPSVAGLPTVDKYGNACLTGKVRGDVTAVPAACVVAEAASSLALCEVILDCLGGDTMEEIKDRYIKKG
ncbi:MAG: chorismate synthase [Clostridia bacterium]|nr:chorismate synthase [Clostridia bacterium]